MSGCADCGAPVVADYHPGGDCDCALPLCPLCCSQHAVEEADLEFVEALLHEPRIREPVNYDFGPIYPSPWAERGKLTRTGKLKPGDWVKITGEYPEQGVEGLIIERYRPDFSHPQHTLWWAIETEWGQVLHAPANVLSKR